MKKTKLLLSILILYTSSIYGATPVWFNSKIKTLYPLSDGTIVVIFINPSSSCTNASATPYFRLKTGANSVTQEGLERIYSLLLTAATTKKIVSVNFDSETSNCFINRAQVSFE